MREELEKRALKLLTVKSLVTLTLTATFCAMVCRDGVGQDLMTIYTAVIGFYFGTQSRREENVQQ